MIWQIFALIWTAVVLTISFFMPGRPEQQESLVYLWMGPPVLVVFWLWLTRGPLVCTHPGCDRYSMSGGTGFRARRFWIRAKDLKKDYGIDVKNHHFALGRCHHHPEGK